MSASVFTPNKLLPKTEGVGNDEDEPNALLGADELELPNPKGVVVDGAEGAEPPKLKGVFDVAAVSVEVGAEGKEKGLEVPVEVTVGLKPKPLPEEGFELDGAEDAGVNPPKPENVAGGVGIEAEDFAVLNADPDAEDDEPPFFTVLMASVYFFLSFSRSSLYKSI